MDAKAQVPAVTVESLLAQIEAQNAQIKALVDRQTKPATDRFGLGEQLNCKVSEKGAVSVYGLNTRFPTTMYKSQWMRLLNVADQLRAFIEANDSKLATKAPKIVK